MPGSDSSSSSSSSSSPSSDGGRYVRLRKERPVRYVDGRTQGYRFRLEVIEAANIPAEIFVYQRKPGTLPGAAPIDEFSNVASPADLEESPVGAPGPDAPFFRLTYVELIFRNLDLAEEAIEDLENDIRCLIESLDQMDHFEEEEITLTGTCRGPTTEDAPTACDDDTLPSSLCSSSSSSGPVSYGVRLRKREISEYVEGRTEGYRLRLDVIEAIGIPPEIFVYQRKRGLLPNERDRDEFSNVASPADLEEYPADEPEPTRSFFRLKSIDVVFRNLDLLRTSLNDVRQDICSLIESLCQMETSAEEIITIDRRCYQAEPCPEGPPIFARVVAFPRDPGPNDDAAAGYGNGSIWTNTETCSVWSLQDNTNGEAEWCLVNTASGTLVDLNYEMAANATTADGQLATNTPVAATPFQDSQMLVDVNGHGESLGDGVKAKSCYFSRDGGATALPVQDIQPGDFLYWNGSIAGYELEVDDLVTFNYIG